MAAVARPHRTANILRLPSRNGRSRSNEKAEITERLVLGSKGNAEQRTALYIDPRRYRLDSAPWSSSDSPSLHSSIRLIDIQRSDRLDLRGREVSSRPLTLHLEDPSPSACAARSTRRRADLVARRIDEDVEDMIQRERARHLLGDVVDIQGLAKLDILGFEPLLFQPTLDRLDDVRDLEGLENVVVRPVLHRGDGRLDGAIAGHHDRGASGACSTACFRNSSPFISGIFMSMSNTSKNPSGRAHRPLLFHWTHR